MNERFENIDQLFKDELENYSPEVPKMAWNNISANLNNSRSRKIGAFKYKIAAGIALFLSVGTLLTFIQSDNEETINNFNE